MEGEGLYLYAEIKVSSYEKLVGTQTRNTQFSNYSTILVKLPTCTTVIHSRYGDYKDQLLRIVVK